MPGIQARPVQEPAGHVGGRGMADICENQNCGHSADLHLDGTHACAAEASTGLDIRLLDRTEDHIVCGCLGFVLIVE